MNGQGLGGLNATFTQMQVSNIIFTRNFCAQFLFFSAKLSTVWSFEVESGRRWWGLHWVQKPAAATRVWKWDKLTCAQWPGAEHLRRHIWASFLDGACKIVLDSNVSECACTSKSSARKNHTKAEKKAPLAVLRGFCFWCFGRVWFQHFLEIFSTCLVAFLLKLIFFCNTLSKSPRKGMQRERFSKEPALSKCQR